MEIASAEYIVSTITITQYQGIVCSTVDIRYGNLCTRFDHVYSSAVYLGRASKTVSILYTLTLLVRLVYFRVKKVAQYATGTYPLSGLRSNIVYSRIKWLVRPCYRFYAHCTGGICSNT